MRPLFALLTHCIEVELEPSGPTPTALEVASPIESIPCTTGGKVICGGPGSECYESSNSGSEFGSRPHSKLGDTIIHRINSN